MATDSVKSQRQLAAHDVIHSDDAAELKAKIKATNAKAVVMDELVGIAGGRISPKDAEFALLLFQLNKLASEQGVTILKIHHLSKERTLRGNQRSHLWQRLNLRSNRRLLRLFAL